MVQSEMTMPQICEHYGAALRTVHIWMSKLGIPLRTERPKAVFVPPPHSMELCLDGEEWRGVLGWETLYAVSNLGRVKRLPRRGYGERIVKPYVNDKNWPRMMVCLCNGKREYGGIEAFPHVHKLVLEAFTGEPRPEGMVCCHINGNPSDNRLENLRWGTRHENAADTRRHTAAGVPTFYRPIRH
jgi:hypothetical protein